MNLRFALIVLVLTAAGCGPHIQSARLVDRTLQPADGEVSLFSTKRPECPYEEIALVTGKRRTSLTSLDDVLRAMRERARSLGGDAIVGLGSGEDVSGGSSTDGIVSVESNVLLKGTVARFTDRNCRK